MIIHALTFSTKQDMDVISAFIEDSTINASQVNEDVDALVMTFMTASPLLPYQSNYLEMRSRTYIATDTEKC